MLMEASAANKRISGPRERLRLVTKKTLRTGVDSVLARGSQSFQPLFAGVYTVSDQRTWRVPSTGWYSSPVNSSKTMAGRPVSNIVWRASFR